MLFTAICDCYVTKCEKVKGFIFVCLLLQGTIHKCNWKNTTFTPVGSSVLIKLHYFRK